jgi:glycosyltransferase involved in cell wall biosynthesis
VAGQWQPFVRPGRLAVIYNGVAGPARLAGPRADGERAPTIACIGRIAPEKGQREFVAAAPVIRRTLPECRFAIYGAALFAEAGVRRYDAEVRAAGLREGVEFRGWVADIYQALAQIDLLLVPSAAHEATTRTILEAYAAGVPVIAFRSGGIPEVVEHGRGGWLADSVERMARLAVEALSGDGETRAARSQRARETWESRFTLERYHRELFEALSAGLV